MRSIIRKLSSLALVAWLVGGIATAGCSGADQAANAEGANVSLKLDVNGVHVNSVHVVITGPAGFALTQDFDFSRSVDDTINLNLPVGDGYSITLTTDLRECGAAATFNVMQGQTTNVGLHLNGNGCIAEPTFFSGLVAATLDVAESCPSVFTLTGPNAAVGGKITVRGVVTGGGNGAAAGVTYAWSGGAFDDPNAADTEYTCTSPGAHVLSVTIIGTGSFATCASSASVTVNCAGGETSEDFSDIGLYIGGPCATCESAGNLCTAFRPCDSFGAAVDSQGRLKASTCWGVLACVARTGCAGVGVEGDCYCGTATSSACDAGQGNGACRAEIENGADSTNPLVIQASLMAISNGGGKAMAHVACLNASACSDACAFLYAND